MYLKGNFLGLLDLISRGLNGPGSPLVKKLDGLLGLLVLFELVLQDLDLLSIAEDLVLGPAVVPEEVDLLNPILPDVFHAVGAIAWHGAKSDPLIIVGCHNKAALGILGVKFDLLDGIKVDREGNGIVMVGLKYGKCPVVEDDTNGEPRGFTGAGHILTHPVHVTFFDDTDFEALLPGGNGHHLKNWVLRDLLLHLVNWASASLGVAWSGHDAFTNTVGSAFGGRDA